MVFLTWLRGTKNDQSPFGISLLSGPDKAALGLSALASHLQFGDYLFICLSVCLIYHIWYPTFFGYTTTPRQLTIHAIKYNKYVFSKNNLKKPQDKQLVQQ